MPTFTLLPLGVHGGDVDTDRSAFFLTPYNQKSGIMLDGGSIYDGFLKWGILQKQIKANDPWEKKSKWVGKCHQWIEGYCLTHSHLDHVSGFALRSFLDFNRYQSQVRRGKTWSPIPVLGNKHTLYSLKNDLLNDRVWVALWKKPYPVYKLVDGSVKRRVGPFEVSSSLLNHLVPSDGFLIRLKGKKEFYAHLGDTGPSHQIWNALKPLHRKGQLKAITVEASYSNRRHSLAMETGHLCPSLVLMELSKMVDLMPGGGAGNLRLTGPQIKELARELEGLKIYIYHIKPENREAVIAELDRYKKMGLSIHVLKQGQAVSF